MKTEITVSVVVPVYNAAQYLSECVDSILSQTLENMELILVDDGSTDQSGEICERYQNSYPSIVVIHKENGGASSARLAGTKIARGRYVGFVDSDDLISPYMYETLFSAAIQLKLDCAKIETGNLLADKRPVGVSSAEAFTVYTGDELKKRYIQIYMAGKNETVSMCDKIVRRSILLSGNAEEEVSNTLEDFFINMNMALKYSRYGELKKIFYFVRYREGSLSRRYSDDDFYVLLKVWTRKNEIMAQIGCTDEEKMSAHHWFVTYAVSLVTKLFEFQKGKEKTKKALEMLQHSQVVQSCNCLIHDVHADCPLTYRMIGHKQFQLALVMIVSRYIVRRIYGKVKYGNLLHT